MLLASCEELQFRMGGVEASKDCDGLICKWDKSLPVINHLERNMRLAKEVLTKN